MQVATNGGHTEGLCDMNIHTHGHSCPHSNRGTIQSSGNVYVEGRLVAKIGDGVSFSGCQHGGSGKVTSGSSTVFANGAAITYVGGRVNCQMCGKVQQIVDGAATVSVGS